MNNENPPKTGYASYIFLTIVCLAPAQWKTV